MMDIFTTKESALIHLNSTRIAAGEIRVYRYYSATGSTDSFVVIGLQDGIGPDCYQILSKRKNLIVNIDTELPDASRLIQGQIHVCPVNGIYHMVYIEDSQRIDREISDSEVYYVEDFDSGFMYYLDRYTCKKLDDYFSKVYIDLSNTNALYEAGKYPETTVTVWKDNTDITSACQIGITTVGCSAIYDGSKTIRVTAMTDKTAKVILKVIYRGNTYQETWNIQKVQEGIKGADAEIWTVLSKNSFIREPDMQSTIFQVLYQSGTETSHLEVGSLQNYGLRLTYEYSDGTVGQIDTQNFEFEPRISDDNTELTFCIVRLLNQDSEVLSAITLPYLPNTNALQSGQGVYKAIVFCRSNDMPETPLGGSWDSPIPTIGQWSQEAPEGNEVLWTTTRIFTTDAKTPQDATWSVPSRISNTENLEVMYSTCQDSTIVGTPSTKPENWEAVVTGIAYFMATRTITNGVPGLWQVFAIHGIDGEAGDYKNYIYYSSVTKPETPVGSHPDGWTDFPDSDGIWWMCVGLFSGRTNELIGTWSNPIKVSGLDGEAGQDAPYLIYQYSVGTSPVDAPTYNWSSSIPTVPRGMYLWQRSGTVIPPATAPSTWNVPVRITGEQGEQGAPGTAVTIDLTNEVSSVAADYEGNIVAAATFETTQVLLYKNGDPVDLESDKNVRSITIIPDGVRASVSKSGLVTIHTWTAPKDQDTATVVVNVNYNYNTYTAIYSIQKVKAGSPGEDAVLYSIIPSTNVLRKVNSVISPKLLTAQVRKAVGSKLSNITDLDSEGLVLEYTVNDARNGETYDFVKGIETEGVEYVTLTLKSKTTGSVIDKETILTMESTLDLIVDLTNEVSAIAASEDGALNEYTNFEKSKVRIYYGSKQIDPGSCQIKASWSNMTGEFNSLTGVITPTGWDPDKLNESTGQCVLEVTYKEFTKSVTYTVTKVNSGETPVLYRLMPSVSVVKASATSLSVSTLRCDVWEIIGKTRSNLELADLTDKKLSLVYRRQSLNQDESDDTNINYSSEGVRMSSKIEEVTFYLYDVTNPGKPQLLDQETVPVVKDGTNAYAVVVDLTNESSCVAADSEGVVPEGAYFESTKLLVYRNGAALKLDNPIIGQIELECSGVTAEIDKYGIITIKSWVAPASQRVANIEITVPVDGVDYKCIYSITKVNAGASGESPVIYSLMPSSNIIRKLNGNLSTNRLFVSILRTQGLSQSTVLAGQEGLVLRYTKNGVESEIAYTDSGIPISDDTEYIQILLKNVSGTIIDRETIIVVETAIDLVVDLTNEVSAIAADPEGNIFDSGAFETSTVQVYYGPERIDFSDPELQADITWTGIQGTFVGGLITPTRWTTTDDIASATVKITYAEYVKTVTYTITRVKAGTDGETPVIWQIVPDVTSIKATVTSVSRDSVAVDIYKIVGASRSIVTSDQFRAERVKLVYARTFTTTGTESEKTYQNYVPITIGMTKVEISLYDYEENVLDRESVPVVYDGINAYNVVLDLTNENSNVIADKDGNLIGTIEETEAKLYCNQEEVRLSSLASNSIVIEWFCLQGSWNVTTGKLTNIRWKDDENSKTSNSGYVRINVTYQGITYSKVYNVTKIRQAEDGKSPVLYSVIPSVNSVKVSGNIVYTPQLTVSVNKHTVDGTTSLSKNSIASEGLEIVYRVDNNPNYQVYSDYIEVQPENIQFDVAVRRQGSDTFLDRETIPVVRDGSTGAKPDWKDYIFCKSETQPAAPTFTKHPANGAADNYGRVWMDGPAGEDSSTWWMSVATIYGESLTNELVSGTSWSEPVRVTGNDGTGYECEYTNAKNLATPPESATWSKTPSTPPSGFYTWMRMRSTKDEAWSYMRITGERGSDGNSIIVKGDLVYVGNDTNKPLTNLDTELMLIGDTPYVEGMDSYSGLIYQGPIAKPVRSIANGDCFLYEGSFFICTGVSDDKNMFQVMSVQGDPGESWITYIAYSTNSQGTDKVETWRSGYNYMGVAVVTYADHTEWASVPAEAYRWARFHGQDGIGQEFVFARNDSTTTAPNFVCPTYDINGKRITEDEYLPTGWTDDPQEVEDVDGHRVQWVSHRTKTNGSWGEFSPRVVWNRFAKDGTGINVKGTLDKIAKTQGTTNYILIPAVASDYTTGSTNIVGDLYLNRIKQTNIANGDTYLYEGFFIICSGRTGSYYSWNIAAAKGDPGDPAFVHVLYADDASGTNETDTWSPGKGYIAIVSTNSEDYPDVTTQRVWVKFQGQDGPGQEFIFIKTKTDVDTFSPSPDTLEANQSDEYLPSDSVWGAWNDDPVDVDSVYSIQWISQRVRDKNGLWGKFSKPTIWSRYAKDGTGINVKGVLQYVGSNTSDYQNYILTDSYTHGSSTSCHGKLYMGGTEVTSVTNGDTYSYDGYFFVNAGSTSGIYDWSVMKAKGDDGKSSYTFIRYSATSGSSGTMSETWAAGMKYIGFATTDKNIVPDKGNFVWSEFLGRDGVGQEFIYCLSDTLTQTMSNITSIPVNAAASYSSNSKAFQDDEFLPSSSYSGDNAWTDDPQDVLEQTGKQRQWISSRVKRNGEWGSFSAPSLWSEVSGSAYNLTLGNQNLDAVFFGTGVVRPSVAHSGIESAIVNGNCAGTTVNYLKGNQSVATTFTVVTDQDVSVYIYNGSSWQTLTGQGSHNVSGSMSNLEIYVECQSKSVNQWTTIITSADGVSKSMTVTRTAFAPSISLGISSYGYNKDDNGTITYSPAKSTDINVTYLSNGRLTTLDAFTDYGYYVRGRYVSEAGAAGSWYRLTNSSFTLQTIVGNSNPSGGSLEFEVTDGSETFCRATISIVSSADLDSVKTYLLDGNAAITGHLWAKDGKIGNWIINALDSSTSTIYLSDGTTVLASYDSNYPVGSLRSSDGTIVLDPSSSNPSIKISGGADYGTNTIVLDKTGLSTKWTAAHDSEHLII